MVSLGRKSPYTLHPISQKFPQQVRNSSSVRLIADGPLSSFQGRSSIASSFHASLLQSIDSVVLGFVPAGSVSSSPTLPARFLGKIRAWSERDRDVEAYRAGVGGGRGVGDERERETDRDRDTDRDKERPRDRQTETKTETETDRQTDRTGEE